MAGFPELDQREIFSAWGLEKERLRYPYLTIMGPTGVGKTALAKRIAEPLGCILLTEESAAERNPFLTLFYEDPERWSFQSQVFYLAEKVDQLEEICPLLNQGPVLHEPPIFEDVEVYARQTLKGAEWDLYYNLYQVLMESRRCPQPDAVVYLKADLNEVMHRIRQRAEEEGGKRVAELKAPADYWEAMIRRNEEWVVGAHPFPILGFDTNGLNFVGNQDHLQQAIEEIRGGVCDELWEKREGRATDGYRLILPEKFRL